MLSNECSDQKESPSRERERDKEFWYQDGTICTQQAECMANRFPYCNNSNK